MSVKEPGQARDRVRRVGTSLMLLVGLSQLFGLLEDHLALPQALRRLIFAPVSLLLPAAYLLRVGPGLAPLLHARPRLGLGRLMGLFAPVLLWVNLLFSALRFFTGASGAAAAFGGFADARGWLVTLLSACLIAPVAEELLFRGCVQPLLAEAGRWVALGVTALLFALLHSPAELPVAFFQGLVLGLAVLAGQAVLPCMLLHGANNLAALAMSTIGAIWGDDAALAFGAVLAVALVPLFCYHLVLFRRAGAPLLPAEADGVGEGPAPQSAKVVDGPGLLAELAFLLGCLLVTAQFVLMLLV